MKKTDKVIVNFIFITPVVILFIYFLYSLLFSKSTVELVWEDNLKENFDGRVRYLYHDLDNHNVKVAVLSNNYQYKISPIWESIIKKGDSISKKAGSFKLTIYRGNELKEVLDYRDTYKK